MTTKSYFVLSEGKNTSENLQKYDLGRRLGTPGNYGYAIHARRKSDNADVAIKVINKYKYFKRANLSQIMDMFSKEINIMKEVDHPNIIKLHEAFESTKDLYVVMELCRGGELFDQLQEKGF